MFLYIAAGGSLGAFLGSEISKQLASTFNESGIIFYIYFNYFFKILALATGIILLKRFVSLEDIDKAAGGTSFDALKNLIASSQIRSIGLYMYLWTSMMTIHWVTSIDIVNAWSSDGGNRIIFFSNIEQTVTISYFVYPIFLNLSNYKICNPTYFNVLRIYIWVIHRLLPQSNNWVCILHYHYLQSARMNMVLISQPEKWFSVI